MQSAVLEAKLAEALVQLATLQKENATLRLAAATLQQARAKNTERSRRFRAKHRNVAPHCAVSVKRRESLDSTAQGPEPRVEFGTQRNLGKPIASLPTREMGWYVDQLTKAIANPAKAPFRAANERQLQAFQAELAKRSQGEQGWQQRFEPYAGPGRQLFDDLGNELRQAA